MERKRFIQSAPERARIIQHSFVQIAQRMIAEMKGQGWKLNDSPLLPRDSQEVGSFNDTFAKVLPEGFTDVRHYLETTLADQRGHLLGVEFGGPASTLFSQFTPGFFERTIGEPLTDQRNFSQINTDRRRNHTITPANIFTQYAQEVVDNWRGRSHGRPRRVNVIFERLLAGMDIAPKEPKLMLDVTNNWYRMLAQGGIMFLQIPPVMEPVMDAWVAMIKQKYRGKIEVQYAGREGFKVMRLRRLRGAPENLPLLAIEVADQLVANR